MNTTITRSTTTALEPPLPGPEFQTKRAPLPDPGSIPIMLEYARSAGQLAVPANAENLVA